MRYSLQRITGLVTLVFLVYHLWHMHWLGEPFGGAFFDPETAPSTAAAAMQRWWFNAPVYVIGVAAAVFHLANGIWTALITWGVTVGRESQRKAGWVCGVLGVLLGAAGLASVWGFERFPQQVEAGVTVEVGMDEPIFVPD